MKVHIAKAPYDFLRKNTCFSINIEDEKTSYVYLIKNIHKLYKYHSLFTLKNVENESNKIKETGIYLPHGRKHPCRS